MASATLEMFIKLVGANKVARSFNTISNELKEFRDQTDKAEKKNKKFASSLSGLQKTAIAALDKPDIPAANCAFCLVEFLTSASNDFADLDTLSNP